MDKFEELHKKIDEAKTKSLVKDEMRSFAELLIAATNKNKQELSQLSLENIKVIKDSIAFIEENSKKFESTLDDKINTATGQFQQDLALLKSLIDKVQTIRPVDGIDGKDADEEVIVEKVLEKIKLPEQKEVILDDGKQIAEKLNQFEEVVDQKVIKGLVKKITDLSSNIAHGAVRDGAKLYTGTSEARVRELIATTPGISTGGASTLAEVSTGSTDTAKSLYTMTSGVDVQFKTSGALTALYLKDSNGNVGIGTTSPGVRLEVVGGLFRLSNATTSGMRINKTGATEKNWYIYNSQWDTDAFSIGDDSTNKFAITSAGEVRLGSNVNSPTVTITTAGNVGIGTVTPLLALQVVGDIRASASIGAYGGLGAAGGSGLTINASSALLSMYNASAAESVHISAAGDSYLNGGNVGIGTTAPGVKLQINNADSASMTAGTAAGDFALLGTTGLFGMYMGHSSSGNGWIQVARNDSATYYNLSLQANGGNVGIGTEAPGNKLSVYAPTTADALADVMIGTSATTQKGLVIQGKASQTAVLQSWESSVGAELAWVDSAGSIYSTSNVAAGNSFYLYNSDLLMYATAAVGDTGNAYTFADASGTNLRQIKASSLLIRSTLTGTTLASVNNDGSAYFSGNVGIGTTAPTAVLHLKAGTATASTAPLKFTSGTLNTTAEAGAVEFLTDAYYATTTTNAVRRMIVTGNTGRATAQTAANASVATYTLGATDASFEVSANVLVTTSSAEAFTVTVDYTDEGNTARTITLNFQLLAGTIGTAIAFANGAVPYEGLPIHIRCKASTAITVKTAAGGTYTGATYNVEAVIKQIA